VRLGVLSADGIFAYERLARRVFEVDPATPPDGVCPNANFRVVPSPENPLREDPVLFPRAAFGVRGWQYSFVEDAPARDLNSPQAQSRGFSAKCDRVEGSV